MSEPTNEEVVQLQHEFEALLSGEYPAATTEAADTATLATSHHKVTEREQL